MAGFSTKNSSIATLVGLIAICHSVALVCGQDNTNAAADTANNDLKSRGGYGLSSLPGGATAGRFLASASDGMSRYLASDGPIQPALTAIGGLPLRATEAANRGITSISTGLDSAAQGLSRSAGQGGQIRMPGMDALESSMPASFASLGQTMQGAIRAKNNFIRGQAEAGIAAGDRLRDMMSDRIRGLTARSSGHMSGMGNMMSQATDALQRGGSEIQSQLKKSLDGTMGRLSSLQGIGQNMRGQMEGLGRTLSGGLQGTLGTLQSTGEKMRNQLQSNHAKNTQAMSKVMSSMQGSMGEMGQNMQKNLHGVMQHAQNAASTVTESLQNVISGPINMLQSLGGGMMKGGSGHQGGRY